MNELDETGDVLLASWQARWSLTPAGAPIVTPSSYLLPVVQQGTPAMLKIARVAEERNGANLLAWWQGDGAARVLAQEGDAIMLERAEGTRSLVTMAQHGNDDEASRILCAAADRLHAPRGTPPTTLVPLPIWFEELAPAAARYGGVLRTADAVATSLLADPQDLCVLHGDLHHGNVLDFGQRGWLAIDPKGVWGERGYDYANIFCNPDWDVATTPGRLSRQLTIVAEAARLDRTRLLHWVLAYAGLSAAWSLQDGDDPTLAMAVARLAAAELGDRVIGQ